MAGPLARALTLVGAAALALAVLTGCGGDDEGAASALAERVPPDAYAYGEVLVRPGGELEAAIEDNLTRFPGGEDAIDDLLEMLAEDAEDCEFERDIDPWLGERFAFFFDELDGDEPIGSLLVESTDDDAARSSLERCEPDAEPAGDHRGVELLTDPDSEAESGSFGTVAVDDGVLLAGDEDAVRRSIDAARGDALGDVGPAAVAEDADQELGWLGVDVQRILDLIPEEDLGLPRDRLEELFTASGADPDEPVGMSLKVERGKVIFDVSAVGPEPGDASELLGDQPADSLLAVAFDTGEFDLGELARFILGEAAREEGTTAEELEQELGSEIGVSPVDLAADVRSLALHVGGAGALGIPGFGAVVELETEDRAVELIGLIRDALGDALAEEAGVALEEAEGGDELRIRVLGLPITPVIRRDGARLLAGSSAQAAESAAGEGRTLADEGRLDDAREALGDDYDPSGLIDLGRLIELVAELDEAFSITGAGTTFTNRTVQLDDPDPGFDDPFGGPTEGLGFDEVLPYLEPLGAVYVGDRRDGDRSIYRYVVELENDD